MHPSIMQKPVGGWLLLLSRLLIVWQPLNLEQSAPLRLQDFVVEVVEEALNVKRERDAFALVPYPLECFMGEINITAPSIRSEGGY